MIRDERRVYATMLEALRSIANNTCCAKCQEAGLIARAALRAIDEERTAPPGWTMRIPVSQADRDAFAEECRRDEEREIRDEIDAEEEREGWDQMEEDEAEFLGLDRESYDSLMYALEKDD